MLEKIKSLSLMTKLLYLFTFILFFIWVLPKISSYYANVSEYQENLQELRISSSKYGLSTDTQQFSETLFKHNSELLFSKVEIESLGKKKYEVYITIGKEDLKTFHTFIETLSLLYYVEIKDALEFKTENELINIKLILETF